MHKLQFDVTQRGSSNAWRINGGKDLLEGVWLVNTYQYPDIEYEQLSKGVRATLLRSVGLSFKAEIHPVDQIKILNSVLFGKLHFGAKH